MTRKSTCVAVDEYLAAVAPDARRVLRRIRALVAAAVPDAQQVISYTIRWVAKTPWALTPRP